MVSLRWAVCVAISWMATDESSRPPIERLDPGTRVAVVMALLAIIVLGVALVTIILLVGSWTRRQGKYRPPGGRRGSSGSSYIPAPLADAPSDERAGDDVDRDDDPDNDPDNGDSAEDASGRETLGGDSFEWRETVTGD